MFHVSVCFVVWVLFIKYISLPAVQWFIFTGFEQVKL